MDFWTYQQAEHELVTIDQIETTPTSSDFTPAQLELEQPTQLYVRPWPLVEFASGKKILCSPQRFDSQNAEGRVQASREQVSTLYTSVRG